MYNTNYGKQVSNQYRNFIQAQVDYLDKAPYLPFSVGKMRDADDLRGGVIGKDRASKLTTEYKTKLLGDKAKEADIERRAKIAEMFPLKTYRDIITTYYERLDPLEKVQFDKIRQQLMKEYPLLQKRISSLKPEKADNEAKRKLVQAKKDLLIEKMGQLKDIILDMNRLLRETGSMPVKGDPLMKAYLISNEAKRISKSFERSDLTDKDLMRELGKPLPPSRKLVPLTKEQKERERKLERIRQAQEEKERKEAEKRYREALERGRKALERGRKAELDEAIRMGKRRLPPLREPEPEPEPEPINYTKQMRGILRAQAREREIERKYGRRYQPPRTIKELVERQARKTVDTRIPEGYTPGITRGARSRFDKPSRTRRRTPAEVRAELESISEKVKNRTKGSGKKNRVEELLGGIKYEPVNKGSDMSGMGKKKGNSKAKARGALISKLMKEKGLTLPQASKYIKENNLKY